MNNRFEDVPRETVLVVAVISGSHVIHHLYLVLLPPIFSVLATDFGVDLAALGIAMGAQALINTVLQLPYGYLADNYDRTVTLGLSLGLGALGASILATAPTFGWLLFGQCVLGAGIAGHHPAHFPLLSDATTERVRGRAYSVHALAGNVGFAAPPVVLLGVAGIPGLTWRHAIGLIAVVGLIYGVVACYVVRYRVSDDVTRPNRREAPRGDGESRRNRALAELRALGRAPSILALGVVAMLGSIAFWGLTSFVPVFLENGYDVVPGLASLTLTAMFVAGGALILVGGTLTDRLRPGPILAIAYSLVGVFTLVLATQLISPLFAMVAAVLAGSFVSFGAPARDKLADVLSTRADIGRNFAVVTLGIMIGNTVAPPMFGALIETNGYQVAFTLVGAFGLLSGLATAYIVVRYRDHLRLGTSATPSD